MLVLTRKLNEAVFVGENIRVRVLAVQGQRVRLGIEAPEDVAIRRQEICFEVPGGELLARPESCSAPG